MSEKIYKDGDTYYKEDIFSFYALYAYSPDAELWRSSASVRNEDLKYLEVVSE